MTEVNALNTDLECGCCSCLKCKEAKHEHCECPDGMLDCGGGRWKQVDEEDEQEDPFDCKCIVCDKVFATAEESCGWTQRERTFCSKKCEETMPDWTSDEDEEEECESCGSKENVKPVLYGNTLSMLVCPSCA